MKSEVALDGWRVIVALVFMSKSHSCTTDCIVGCDTQSKFWE